MSKATLTCVQIGHTWSSIAGGYWCSRCKLAVTDKDIALMRQVGFNLPLDELIELTAKSSSHYVRRLYGWLGE